MENLIFENKIESFYDYLIESITDDIKHSHTPKDTKELMLKHANSKSEIMKSKLFDITIPTEFKSKLSKEDLPSGFSMGIDKNGFFIYTHRCRSHSHEDYMKIPKKNIIFVDSTG